MIQEKDFLYKVPVKNALVTAPGQQVRNPEILVDVEGGEFMRGNILDANSTNKLINQSVKDAVDNKLVESGYVIKELLENETKARTKGDEDLGVKIKAEQTRAEGKEKEISNTIPKRTSQLTNDSKFIKANKVELNNYTLYGKLYFGVDQNISISVNGIFDSRNNGFSLNHDGLFFFGRNRTEIPTAGGQFIDINNYVLKSVYDEKIAALEARIAALEAKHPEATA